MFRRKKEETMIPWDISDKKKIPDEIETGEDSPGLSEEVNESEREVPSGQEESEKDVSACQEESEEEVSTNQEEPEEEVSTNQEEPEEEVSNNQEESVNDLETDLSADVNESDGKTGGPEFNTPAALIWAKAREKASAGSLEQENPASQPGPDEGAEASGPDVPAEDIPQEAGPEPAVSFDGGPWETQAEKADDSYSSYYPEDEEEEEEYTEEEPRESKWQPVLIWIKRIFLTIGCFVAALIMTFFYSLWSEYTGGRVYTGNEIQIEIPKGTTPRQAAEILQDAGAIHYKSTFLAKVLIEKKNDGLKYGSYKISKGDSLDDIVNKLTTGSMASEESRFTIPEGYSIEMIADRLEQGYGISGDDFLKAVDKAQKDFVYADQLPSKDKVAYPLQGYLFPDTYHITKETTADQLVSSILKNFDKVFDESRQKKAKKLGLSVEDVLIMASLVQKESYNEDDYPAIAGVINNRLDKGMKLQFDSTVVYAISDGKFGVDRVTYKDLDVDSPYNTYHIKGLPPGPICNPGLKAIDAVLNPEKHDYLYFRTDPNKDDGSNIFTKTYEEHMAVDDGTDVEEITKKDQSSEEDKTNDSKSKDSKSKETKTSLDDK